MARPKKHPRLPNKYGSIKKLSGKNRTNPYGVYPPTTEFDTEGRPKAVPALAYVNDWYYGLSILTAYHAGTYVPGVYPPPPNLKAADAKDMDATIRAILQDYGQVRASITGQTPSQEPTFREVYEQFYAAKYTNSKRAYSSSTINATKAAFKNCSALHDKVFRDLRHSDLQSVVDDCTLKHASLELIVLLFHQMYTYADSEGLCDKDYSSSVKINIDDDDEGGVPFTDAELKTLWANQKDPTVEFILIMCYSGFRLTAYRTLKIDLKEQYFQGGVKTKASKDRIVPIHPSILPLVRRRMRRDGGLLVLSTATYRKCMYAKLEELKIARHTPHDCRHTFSWLCEKYEVAENDRKRMLGHSFGNDLTNNKYGHRTLDELKKQICKIKVCR